MAGTVRLKLDKYIFILGVLIAAYTLLLNRAIYLQYRGVKQIQDFPDYLSTIYLTSRGDIFGHYVGWCGGMEKMTFLGAHIAPAILLFAGIYRLFNHPMALFTLQIFSAGLTSLAIFYVGVEVLKNRLAAFILVVSFLLYQPAMSAVVTSFQPENFSMPLLAFMFLSLIRKKYGWCIFLSLLLLSLKENMGFIVAMFGLYTFFKSNRKLGLFIFIFGFLWSVISIGFIIPHFREGRPVQSLLWFSHLGGSWAKIMENLTFHPLLTFKKGLSEYWPLKASFQWYMLGPLVYLPLLYPESLLIALPVIGQIYLAKHHFMPVSLCYYHASIDPLLFIAAIYAISRIAGAARHLFSGLQPAAASILNKAVLLVPLVAILGVNLYISLFRSQFFDLLWAGGHLRIARNPIYVVSERDNLAWQVLDEYRIPEGSSLATSVPFFEVFAGSQRQSDFTLYEQEVPEYIFLDALNYRFGNAYNSLIRMYLERISGDRRYELVFEKEGMVIYRRKPELGRDDFMKELSNFSLMSYLVDAPETGSSPLTSRQIIRKIKDSYLSQCQGIRDISLTVEHNGENTIIYKRKESGTGGTFFNTRVFINRPGRKLEYIYDGNNLCILDRFWSQAEIRKRQKEYGLFYCLDTFGGVVTPAFRAEKEDAALSINPERTGHHSEQTSAFRPESRRIDLAAPRDEGRDYIGGREAWIIEVGDIFGAFGTRIKKRWEKQSPPVPARIWIDAERGIILKIEMAMPREGSGLLAAGDNKLVISYEDYRQAGGMWFAFKKNYYLIHNHSREIPFMTERIRELKVNTGLPKDFFNIRQELDAAGIKEICARDALSGSLISQWRQFD